MTNDFSYVAPVSSRNPASTLTPTSAQPGESKAGDSVSSVMASATQARAARVAELKEQYQAGKYKVELKQVSSKIIDKHLDT